MTLWGPCTDVCMYDVKLMSNDVKLTAFRPCTDCVLTIDEWLSFGKFKWQSRLLMISGIGWRTWTYHWMITDKPIHPIFLLSLQGRQIMWPKHQRTTIEPISICCMSWHCPRAGEGLFSHPWAFVRTYTTKNPTDVLIICSAIKQKISLTPVAAGIPEPEYTWGHQFGDISCAQIFVKNEE